MKLTLLLTALLTIITLNAYAHGEDKPGPNGGHIKMPANFHTELLILPNNQLQIFLIDIEFKNPTVENSTVTVTYKNKKRLTKLKCKPQSSWYICSGLPAGYKGLVQIKAKRLGVEANTTADYTLPLVKFVTAPTPEVPKNNNHHQHH